MNQLDDRVLQAIRKIVHAADSYSKRVERSAGITIPQLVLLRTLQSGGEMTTNRLANAVSLAPPTVVAILDKLEKRGLIGRHRGTVDRRVVFVRLTEDGTAALAAAPRPLDLRFVERFAALPLERQTALVGALEEVVELMAPLVPEPMLAEAEPAPAPAPPAVVG